MEFSKSQHAPLLRPTIRQRDALNQMMYRKIGWLPTCDNGLDDIRGQEGKIDEMADITLVDIISAYIKLPEQRRRSRLTVPLVS